MQRKEWWMQRKEWLFEYTAGALLIAAESEFDRREKRLDYWKDKRDEVLEQLKEEGLSVTQWNEGYTKSSMGNRIDVEFDAKLMTRLRECENFLEKARIEKKEYVMWIQVFSEYPETKTLQLDAEDVAHFGLGKSVEPDFVAPEDAEHTGTPSLT